jgi:hypothetical protein
MLKIIAVAIALNDVKSFNTIRISYYNIMVPTVKARVLKEGIHSLLDIKIMNKSAGVSLD